MSGMKGFVSTMPRERAIRSAAQSRRICHHCALRTERCVAELCLLECQLNGLRQMLRGPVRVRWREPVG